MSNDKKPSTPQPAPKRESPVPSRPERPQPVQQPDKRIGPDSIPKHLEPSKPWPKE